MKTIEQKAKAYDEALKVLHKYDGANIMFSQSLKEEMFPELKESEDERTKNEIIAFVEQSIHRGGGTPIPQEQENKWIAWLEKQGAERKQLYVRFGDIPSNEKSKIYRGEEEIGEENGVSVYPAFELNGNIVLGLTLPITRTTLYTQQHLLEYDNRPCYLVSGDYVGSGTDGEPLIRNISIIKRLDNYRSKEGEQKPTCILDNSESNVKFPFKAKVKSNGKIVTIQGGQLSMDCKKYVKYQSNVEDGYKVYEPEDLELVCNIEQKSNDKVEPKFKVGNWYQCTKDFFGKGVTFDKNTAYYCAKEGCLQNGYGCHIAIVKDLYDNFKLWAIEDAKDGDILAVDNVIYIYKRTLANHIVSYCKLINGIFESTVDARTYCEGNTCTHPATKEQRDQLEKAITEAGYKWNKEDLKLEKI